MKRWIALLLIVTMLFAMSACAGNSAAPTNQATSTQTTRAEDEKDTIVITDMAGREVEITRNPQRIVTLFMPTGILPAMGAQDRVAGHSGPSGFLDMIYPSMADVARIDGRQLDFEVLAALNPDVVFSRALQVGTLEDIQALGIPAIGVQAENIEEIGELLTLMGKILGLEQEAADAAVYYYQIIDKARALANNIPDADKVTAIFMGNEMGSVAHGNMLQSKMIETAGGVSMTVDPEVPTNDIWPIMGTEKIFTWNPDFIFLTNHSMIAYSADDILGDSTWANVNAVKNGRVYTVPSVMDSWEFPGLSTAVGTLWMLHKMYPELLPEADFHEIVAEYYKTVFDIDATPELLGY